MTTHRFLHLPSLFVAAAAASPALAHDTTRVSVDSSGAEGNSACVYQPAISADGDVVAFTSYASNLFPNDTGHADVFVHVHSTGETELVSVAGGVAGNNDSWDPAISADGMVVAFWTHSTNLVSGDTNGWADVFVHDRASGLTTRVSVDSAGVQGNFNSWYPSISADGTRVAFHSSATNLVVGDANGKADVFVHDRVTGITTRASVASSGTGGSGDSWYCAISADGTSVAFYSDANDLVAGDLNASQDVFVHDLATGTTERVSVDSAGAEGNNHSNNPAISADGQVVAYESWSSNLVAGDTNFTEDVFVHDRATGSTMRVSVDSAGGEANSLSVTPVLSADGSRVSFTSFASDLVAGDTNNVDDVFVHFRDSGETERLSVTSADAEAHGPSTVPAFAADGITVAFLSHAPDLVPADTNTTYDVFVRELCAGASWENYGAGFPGTNGVPAFTMQADPVLGTTVTADLGNSLGAPTFGWVAIGTQRAVIHTNKGGDLLGVFTTWFVVAIPAGGLQLAQAIPDDEALCGAEVVTQVMEIDVGATKKVSFTRGLSLRLGR